MAVAGASAIRVSPTPLSGVLVLEPVVFADSRGFFLESYSKRSMAELGILHEFAQDNHSFSHRNVLRGLHYQIRHCQGKLIRVPAGEIFDVALDLRRNSPTLGQWYGIRLSGVNKHMLWIPPGLAHGFYVLSESAHVFYKATDFYDPESERTIAWNDPDLQINWQLRHEPIVSGKDNLGIRFREAELCD